VFCILILWRALTPVIQGGSRMRELRPYGFVRGVPGDWHPYRDSQPVFELSLSGNFPLWARGVLVWAHYL